MEFMLNGRGWRITDVVHRSKYKGVEQHARKEDADEGSNNANHFSVSPLGSLSNRRGFRRSEEHTSELQSLMRISYAVFCLKKKIKHNMKEILHEIIQPHIQKNTSVKRYQRSVYKTEHKQH